MLDTRAEVSLSMMISPNDPKWGAGLCALAGECQFVMDIDGYYVASGLVKFGIYLVHPPGPARPPKKNHAPLSAKKLHRYRTVT
jgi:hypothetical protein